MAKPRVFVSSTYYDLKYVRERLERFISSYCFDPVLFESDEVFFNPNLKLDESCYKEVENCHIMILIVGGRYGSLASDQKEKYEQQFVSITRKEYDTARKKGIPVMAFVEQNVFAEYKTFMANKNNLPAEFKFAFVDDARVFDFISNLEQGAIKIFSKVDDIEHYFSHQIAGMLLSHLKELQEKKAEADIKNAVDEIKVVSQSMQEMINFIAGKILGEDKAKYQELLLKQNESLIDFFIEIVNQNITINIKGEPFEGQEATDCVTKICEICHNTVFNEKTIKDLEVNNNYKERFKLIQEIQQNCAYQIKQQYNDIDFNINLYRLLKPMIQILNIVNNNDELKKYFDMRLNKTIGFHLIVPF